jgi:hypothetical protein
MRLLAAISLTLTLSGCAEFWRTMPQAITAVAIAAAAQTVGAIANAALEEAGAAATASTDQSAEPDPCNYWMRCWDGDCWYETSDGRSIRCQKPDCSDGIPPSLSAWCPSR